MSRPYILLAAPEGTKASSEPASVTKLCGDPGRFDPTILWTGSFVCGLACFFQEMFLWDPL